MKKEKKNETRKLKPELGGKRVTNKTKMTKLTKN